MEFTLKGDYFTGQFTHPEGMTESDINSCDEKLEKVCPADTNHKLWRAGIDYKNIDKVIESAISGFDLWRKIPIEDRVEYLQSFQEAAHKRKDDIAKAIALETGKPLWEANTEAGAIVAKVNVTIGKKINFKTKKVIVDGVNTFKKAIRPTQENPNGGFADIEKGINISNVAVVSPKTGGPTRVRIELKDGKKTRVATKCGSVLS